MKLKLSIIAFVFAALAIGAYVIVNTGLLTVYSVVPNEGAVQNNETARAASELSDPNQSVRPAVFRTITERDNILFLRGTAEPDIVVSVLGNGERRRQIRADEDGIWETEIDVSVDNVLALSLTSFLDENISIFGDELLIRVRHPDSEEAVPNEIDVEIESLALPELPEALILLTAPGGPARIVQTPFGSLPNQNALTLGAIEYDDLGGVIFSGFASEAGRVRIYGDGELIGESRVSNNGRWFLIAGETLPEEPYILRVQLQEVDGTESSITINFQRLVPGRDAQISPYVVFNDKVWHIRRNLAGGGVQYTAILSPQNTLEEAVDTAQ